MKIAFLCKRQYMSKDVILDKYARLYEIPNQLALLGHEVECFCLSYQSHDDGEWDESSHLKKLKWISKSYKGLSKVNLISYPFKLFNDIQKFKPDVIIAASDIPHIIMGAWIAHKQNIPFIADLYDNFEAYGQAKIPFIKFLFNKALSSADMISTTSYSLAEKIKIAHPHVAHIFPMPSVINQDAFKVGDKQKAREYFNLPLDKQLIGTAGGLTKMKGIEDLFQAWDHIRHVNDDVYLILAGPTEKQTELPNDSRVIYLGMLSHAEIVLLFQALDVGVLCIPDDDFGRYCFPQKAYEMIATHLPIVSTAVGDMAHLLEKESALLYTAKDPRALAEAVLKQLNRKYILEVNIPNWQQSLESFEKYLPKTQ